MLPPNEINPLQIPHIIDLHREVVAELSHKTRRRVDPRSAAVQRIVIARILEVGGSWRCESEAAAAKAAAGN